MTATEHEVLDPENLPIGVHAFPIELEDENEEPRSLKIAPPGDGAFGTEAYLVAPDLTRLATVLIDRHKRFVFHGTLDIKYLWKRKGSKSKGFTTLGTCQQTGGALQFYSDADFLICLSADAMRERKFTPKQIEAVLYHELCHIGFNDKMQPMLRNHDWAGFISEIEEYGLYLDDMQRVGDAMQMKLFDEGGGE